MSKTSDHLNIYQIGLDDRDFDILQLLCQCAAWQASATHFHLSPRLRTLRKWPVLLEGRDGYK